MSIDPLESNTDNNCLGSAVFVLDPQFVFADGFEPASQGMTVANVSAAKKGPAKQTEKGGAAGSCVILPN